MSSEAFSGSKLVLDSDLADLDSSSSGSETGAVEVGSVLSTSSSGSYFDTSSDS